MPSLHVVHNISDHGHFGGTEIVLDELLALGGAQYVLVRDPDVPGQVLVLDRNKRRVATHAGHPVPHDQVFEPDLTRFFRDQLRALGIDTVIFHHLMGLPVNLLSVPRLYGVRAVVVWHDFYLVCPSFNLLNDHGRYCEVDRLPPPECIACAARQFGWPETAMSARRRFIRDALEEVDLHVFSTPESRRIAGRIYGIEPDRSLICPVPSRLPLQTAPPPGTRDMSKVLILGNFAHNKGGSALAEMLEPLLAAKFGLRIAGRADPQLVEALGDRVEFTGPYARSELGRMAGDCGIALFLSVWPETYCITLSEVRQLGLAPVAPALGAFRDRIDPGRDGWLFDRNAPDAVLSALEAARQAGLADCRETPLAARDYAARIEAALPAAPDEALMLRDSQWLSDAPFDMQSFSVTHPLYYLPGSRGGPAQVAVAQTRHLAGKAHSYYREHGLRPTLRRTALYLRQRGLGRQ